MKALRKFKKWTYVTIKLVEKPRVLKTYAVTMRRRELERPLRPIRYP